MRSRPCPKPRKPRATRAREMTSAAPTMGVNAGSAPRSPRASARITNPSAMPAHVAPMRLRSTRSSTGGAGARAGGGKVAARRAFHQLVRGCGGMDPPARYVPEGASAGGGEDGGTLAARGGGGVMGGKRWVSSRSSSACVTSCWLESGEVRSILCASFMSHALTPVWVKRPQIRSECTFPGGLWRAPGSSPLSRLFPGIFGRCKHAGPKRLVDLEPDAPDLVGYAALAQD